MVTLSVPTGQSLDTQSLEATLSEVADGAETRTLQTPLRISVTKSAVWAVYPLTYSRSFNAKPMAPHSATSSAPPRRAGSPSCGASVGPA